MRPLRNTQRVVALAGTPRPWLLACSVWLAGCAQTPPYQAPAIDVPAAYKEQGAAAAQGVWQPARPADAHLPAPAWWSVYGDATLNRLQQQAEAGSPSLAQSAARLRAAQAAVASSSAAALPTLGASASSSRARSGTQLADGSSTARIGNTHSMGLNASWELDLWGRVSAGVSAAQASAQASADDLAAARLSLQASVAQTYFSLRAAEAQARLLGETLQAYERSWELTRHRQAAGVATSVDVAQAEAQYKSTQVQLLESQTTRAQLEHALAALLGQAPAAFALEGATDLPTPSAVPAALPSGPRVSAWRGTTSTSPTSAASVSERSADAVASVNTRATSTGSARSATSGTTRALPFSSSPASASRRSRRRATAITLAPCSCTSCFAISRPRPDEAPVTTTRRSVRLIRPCPR